MIPTAHAHKSGVIFHFFPRAFKQKKIKALRPKMTKIASRGGSCLNKPYAARCTSTREQARTHTCIHAGVRRHNFIYSVCYFSLFLPVSLVFFLSLPLPAKPDDFVTISRGNGDRVCVGRIGIVNSQLQADVVIMCTQSAGQLISTFLT